MKLQIVIAFSLQYRIKYNVCCGCVIVTGNKNETPLDVDRVLKAFSAFVCMHVYCYIKHR